MMLMLRPFAAATQRIIGKALVQNPRPLYVAARTLATVAKRPSEHLHTHINVIQGDIPGTTTLSDLVCISRGQEALLVGLPGAFPKRTWPIRDVHTYAVNESAYFRGPEGGIHDQEVFVFGVKDVGTLKTWDHDHTKTLDLVEYVCNPSPELTDMLEMSSEHVLYFHEGKVKSVKIAHLPGLGHAMMNAMEDAAETTCDEDRAA